MIKKYVCIGCIAWMLSPVISLAAPDSSGKTAGPSHAAATCSPGSPAQIAQTHLILFASQGKIGLVHPDGSGETYLDFPEKNQLSWQPTTITDPARGRIVFRSQEKPADPKAGFYDKGGAKYARSRLWWYQPAGQQLSEIPLPTLVAIPAILPGGTRMLVTGEEDPDNPNTRIYTVTLDGAEKADFHELSGFAYCFTLSPDGKKVAYHQASEGYKIYTLDLASGAKTLLAGESDYLNFGPSWSPDGQWILYQRYAHAANDPMHTRSDLCAVKSDGSEKRFLTSDQSQWFGTSYGPKENPGRGSNFPKWSPDGRCITYTRCSPGAQTAWVYNKNRPDTDHFNCDYVPELAKGGSQICLIEFPSGRILEVTPFAEKEWAWRTEWFPDSKQIIYARAAVGQNAELWIVNSDSSSPRLLTKGYLSKGADFPMWITLPEKNR